MTNVRSGPNGDGEPAHRPIARAEIELEGNVLVIKRIHARYSGVPVPADKRDAADRALATHQQACPVARSIGAAIAITTDWAQPVDQG